MSPTTAVPWPDSTGLISIPLLPLRHSHLEISASDVVATGRRRSPGDPVMVEAAEDSTLNVHSARELCGYVLYLYQEWNGDVLAPTAARTFAVPVARPDEFTLDRTVWSVVPGVDVVHLPPFMGWIAAGDSVVLDHATIVGRLLEALAALTADLVRDHDIARQAVMASRAEYQKGTSHGHSFLDT